MTKAYKNAVLIILDCLETIGLLVCSLLAGPFLFFRSLDGVMPFLWQLKVLLPRGLFAASLRATLDERLGNFEQAAAIFNHLIRSLEGREPQPQANDPESRLMAYLYNRLARIYLASGRVDDATVVVIRAHRHLGIESLPSIPDLDVRAARIIKAGIAAGKLLDEGGLATLTVRAAMLRKKDEGQKTDEPKPKKKRMDMPFRYGTRSGDQSESERMAKVLPFHKPAPTT